MSPNRRPFWRAMIPPPLCFTEKPTLSKAQELVYLQISAHSVLDGQGSMPVRVLLVEPNAQVAATLRHAGRSIGTFVHLPAFEEARSSLVTTPFDFVIANLRLSEFNGLHLVHLASTHQPSVKCIVYTTRRDPPFAREVQRAGAFYETMECLPVTMAAYFRGKLPECDRRNPDVSDRRGLYRGGRRCWDLSRRA
jgi:hypothetical protein